MQLYECRHSSKEDIRLSLKAVNMRRRRRERPDQRETGAVIISTFVRNVLLSVEAGREKNRRRKD